MSGRYEEERIVLASESDSEREYNENLEASSKFKKKARKTILEYIVVIGLGVLIAFLLTTFAIINARIPSGSMIPTIQEGDRLIGNRIIYDYSDPQRGDIVIFKTPNPEDLDTLYIKRVIGLPGETVEIRAGQVFIHQEDGQIFYLEEKDYLNETPNPTAPENNTSYVLGEDEYFMMGDNRNYSDDSRSWGNVTRDRILAKAWFKYYDTFEIVE